MDKNTIFCKKNLIVLIVVVLLIFATLAVANTFATYSNESSASGTASPRGEYFMDGNTFVFIDKNVDESFVYNFYLTNVNKNGEVYSKSVNIDFTLVINPIFSKYLTSVTVDTSSSKARSALPRQQYTQNVITFRDKVGFSGSNATINYYKIAFLLSAPMHLEQETNLFSISYVVEDNEMDREDPKVDITDIDKQVNTIDFKGSRHIIYLGNIKDTLSFAEDFKLVVANIPENMLIVNVYYYNKLIDTINVFTQSVKDANVTHSTAYLVNAGLGDVIQPEGLRRGYMITVYRPITLPKGVEISLDKASF